MATMEQIKLTVPGSEYGNVCKNQFAGPSGVRGSEGESACTSNSLVMLRSYCPTGSAMAPDIAGPTMIPTPQADASTDILRG